MARNMKSSLEPTYLEGQLLIAMPGMPDKRFENAVIYVCAHSADGAMGLMINRPSDDLRFTDLLTRLKILPESPEAGFPQSAKDMIVLNGGPVEAGRGFVLHSDHDAESYASVEIDGNIRLSASLDILHAIAKGHGPQRAVFALGYTGWSAGQLETEIQNNGWLSCPVNSAIIFDHQFATKYHRALGLLGIDPAMLSREAGHA